MKRNGISKTLTSKGSSEMKSLAYGIFILYLFIVFPIIEKVYLFIIWDPLFQSESNVFLFGNKVPF